MNNPYKIRVSRVARILFVKGKINYQRYCEIIDEVTHHIYTRYCFSQLSLQERRSKPNA